MNPVFTALIAGGAIAALASTAQAEVFDCGPLGDGSYIATIDPAMPDRAEVVFSMGLDSGGATGDPAILMEVPTGSGFRYTGAGMDLRGQGGEVELTVEDMVIVCTILGAGGSAGPMPAQSWGGNVRSGPGMNFDRVGSFREGQPIRLLRNTGVMMNGYPWFEVQDMEGRGGYHWGGIICALPGQPVEGVFQTCP